jgi:hypothetical protein
MAPLNSDMGSRDNKIVQDQVCADMKAPHLSILRNEASTLLFFFSRLIFILFSFSKIDKTRYNPRVFNLGES